MCSFPFVLQRLEACAWIFHRNRAFVDEVIEKDAKGAHLEIYSPRCNGAALAPVRFFAPLNFAIVYIGARDCLDVLFLLPNEAV